MPFCFCFIVVFIRWGDLWLRAHSDWESCKSVDSNACWSDMGRTSSPWGLISLSPTLREKSTQKRYFDIISKCSFWVYFFIIGGGTLKVCLERSTVKPCVVEKRYVWLGHKKIYTWLSVFVLPQNYYLSIDTFYFNWGNTTNNSFHVNLSNRRKKYLTFLIRIELIQDTEAQFCSCTKGYRSIWPNSRKVQHRIGGTEISFQNPCFHTPLCSVISFCCFDWGVRSLYWLYCTSIEALDYRTGFHPNQMYFQSPYRQWTPIIYYSPYTYIHLIMFWFSFFLK